MKFIKWRILTVTCVACILPVLLGIYLWDRLPETIAIHFDINNRPDNFASKGFTVFGLPVLMVLLQLICCVINDINAAKHGERKKFELVTKWIIPIMSMLLYIVTLGIALGWDIDVRKIVAIIVGLVLITTGNYMPKLDYIKNYDVDVEKARKINRFIGFETVIMGILFIISIFLPPVTTIICVCLLIPYAIISAVYGIAVGRKK